MTFSVITNLRMELFEALVPTVTTHTPGPSGSVAAASGSCRSGDRRTSAAGCQRSPLAETFYLTMIFNGTVICAKLKSWGGVNIKTFSTFSNPFSDNLGEFAYFFMLGGAKSF